MQAMLCAKFQRVAFLGILIPVLGGIGLGWHRAGAHDQPNAKPGPTDKNTEKKESAPEIVPAKEAHRNVAIRAQLIKIVDIEREIEAPLKDVLESLSDRFNLKLVINVAAFKELNPPIENVGEIRTKLPKMQGVSVAAVMRIVLSPFNGTYVVRQGFIEITTLPNAQDCAKLKVQISAKQEPLNEVLEDLAEQTGANIVVDLRAEEKAQTFITANLQGVSLGTAVRVLANMADLKSVALDNVLLVTTTENADEVRRDYLRSTVFDQARRALEELKTADGTDVVRLREAINEAIKQMNLLKTAEPMPKPELKE
jgi:hypothetical protein